MRKHWRNCCESLTPKTSFFGGTHPLEKRGVPKKCTSKYLPHWANGRTKRSVWRRQKIQQKNTALLAKIPFLFSSAAIWHGGALSLRQISSHHATPFSIPTAYFPFWRFARVWFPPNDPRRDRFIYTRARKELLKIPTKSILAFQEGLFTLGRQLKKNIHI